MGGQRRTVRGGIKMVLKIIMLLFCVSFIEEMDKARKKKKICDTIYWGFLMVSAAIAVWGM